MSMTDEAREGEVALDFDPAETAGDARLIFVGHISSPWRERGDCPKNMIAARQRSDMATLTLEPPYRQGLDGLASASHVIVLTWLDRARRDLVVQKPRHAETPRGVFSLRSPVRPNPIGLHVCRLVEIDRHAGVMTLDAIDVLDGTPVIDIKPYFASIDAFPDAARPDGRERDG